MNDKPQEHKYYLLFKGIDRRRLGFFWRLVYLWAFKGRHRGWEDVVVFRKLTSGNMLKIESKPWGIYISETDMTPEELVSKIAQFPLDAKVLVEVMSEHNYESKMPVGTIRPTSIAKAITGIRGFRDNKPRKFFNHLNKHGVKILWRKDRL